MRMLWIAINLIVFTIVAGAAHAQGTILLPPKDTNVYDVKYKAGPHTDQACFFEVTQDQTGVQVVDRNDDGVISRTDDALHCEEPTHVDGTENTSAQFLIPNADNTDKGVVAFAFRDVSDGVVLQSAMSNLATAAVEPSPIEIVAGHLPSHEDIS